MFWGCFSYNQKGPCHIYMNKTPQQTTEWAQLIIEKNAKLEPQLCEEFAKQEATKVAKWTAFGQKPSRRPAT